MPYQMQHPEEEMEKLDTNERIGRDPLPKLPEDRFLNFQITNIEYRFRSFNGKPVYLTDTDGKTIIKDEDDQPIRAKEFNIEFTILEPDLKLPNGAGRKIWLSVGKSIGEKSKLRLLLDKFGVEINGNPTAQEIIDALIDRYGKFTVASKPGKSYQKPSVESINPTESVPF